MVVKRGHGTIERKTAEMRTLRLSWICTFRQKEILKEMEIYRWSK